jgi:hypothetical protein
MASNNVYPPGLIVVLGIPNSAERLAFVIRNDIKLSVNGECHLTVADHEDSHLGCQRFDCRGSH